MPTSDLHGNLLLTRVGDLRLAIDLAVVARVVRAVAVTAVAGAPDDALGVISVAGEIIPVLTPRPLLGLPSSPVRAEDRLVLVRAAGRSWALLVDEVSGVLRAGNTAALRPFPSLAHAAIRDMVDVLGEVVQLCDIEMLTEDAERTLTQAQAVERQF